MNTSTGDSLSLTHPYRYEGQPTLEEARRYCARLAKSHYENFLVATIFCPRHLRQHFYNIYAYCRISDDLGDEIGDPQKSLALLDWWETELDAMYDGNPHHPVFVALEETVRRFQIPPEPFRHLLHAFRQDQICTRYPTYDDLLGYCRYSANPVGHLVLYLAGYRDAERFALSDKTCTALQLANFWQDVTRDLAKGRIYIPLEDMARFGYSEEELHARKFTPAFAELMRFEVERTRALFLEGQALCNRVDKRLRLDIAMFTQGGLEVLRRIESQGYDVLSKRPAIPKSRQLALLLKRLVRPLP
ncbi:MAG TPA: squalene synthase HpnC [Chthonomonas sp.]|uniref:squalene synthase HpnC n=1 Tax=Chthonomonas sp. TaxID=2282153 RepID=UPI002B4B91AA|nr:squalene synthase HpnC [Chthonomonas sp.]HLH79840.1 squalene synthase HpnC [Chthonomonas sp.]